MPDQHPDAEQQPEEDLPPAPWQRAPRRAPRRRREPITQEAIVATAIRVLDAEGLDALSMRRIAEELDTGPASLYWHVGSKDGLLDLIFDRVIGEQHVPDPDPGHWQEQLKQVARTQRETILRHRDVVRISLGRIPMGPNALRYAERVIAILRAGGVPDRIAMLSHQLLIEAVNGFTLDETVELEPAAAEGPTEEMGQMARDYVASLPREQFPNLIEVADYYAMTDPGERFELLLDLFVEGLSKRADGG
jgi:AcrR family transcriptional regulator